MTTTTQHQDMAVSIPATTPAEPGWVRALARMKATSLDRRLASGAATATDRLLAARANAIVAPRNRSRLADDWEHLLAAAGQPAIPRSHQLPLQSTAILAAEHHVRELVAALRQPTRVNPQGVALARLLLADGTGPLYNPRRSGDLVSALRLATSSYGSGMQLVRLSAGYKRSRV